ncbi:3186_t:CDS:1, partial [Acaulospora morrowiae]
VGTECGVSVTIDPKELVKAIANMIQSIHTGKMMLKAEQIINTLEEDNETMKILFKEVAEKIDGIYADQIQQLEPESVEAFAQFISKQLFDYLGSNKVEFILSPTELLIEGLHFTVYTKNCLLTTLDGVLWNAKEMLCSTGIITSDGGVYIYIKDPGRNLKYGFRHDKLPYNRCHYERHGNLIEANKRLKQLVQLQKTVKGPKCCIS